MVCQSTEFWASSTRRRASVVSSLSVAVLLEFAWLVSRRTVPVHRRCQGVFFHYFYGASFLAATWPMSFRSTRYGIFCEIPVFSVIWFDSGYTFASAFEVMGDKGVDMPVVVLDTVWSRQSRDLWKSHKSSSWPGCGRVCRCTTTGAWFDGAENCGCSSSKFVDFPFVPQRQLSMVPPIRKTIEIPQLQCVACWLMPLLCMSCLTCPSLCNDRLGMAQIVQKTVWKYRRCSTFAVVDVAVISQRQSRLCREVPQTRSSTGCSSAEKG